MFYFPNKGLKRICPLSFHKLSMHMLENKTKFERSNEKDLHWENKMHKSTKRSSCRINVKSFLSRFVLGFLKPAFHLYEVKIKL